ncbi:MAG TPA: L,D-transpeptidase family protein [Gammaproteobacteria bacterium]|nr:L,D-transpeptidase family protein [Gammaproteobacteria bacterium]
MNRVGLALSLWLLLPLHVFALTFSITPGSDIVGRVQTATALSGEDFHDIGQKFDVGYYELVEANPGINPGNPGAGTAIIIPTQYILPHGQRKGIVINLAELRLYYFHKGQNLVTTHPIGIGRREWETPLGSGKIIEKTKNPSWRPPDRIRAWYEENEMYLPEVVYPGPKNPLGKYAMRLSIPGYLIHGTNASRGIGIRSSSGCIRMHPEDIESLFYKVSIGDPVRIIHQPYKIGRHRNQVYAESHEPLSGSYYHKLSEEEVFEQAVEQAVITGAKFNKDDAREALERSHGYPILVN